MNDYYSVTVKISPNGLCKSLMIVNNDQSARRDWREFQKIKNEVCGPGWVGYEIFPPEHEVVDPSNAFFLWCFSTAQLPEDCGMSGPRYFPPDIAPAPQRDGGEP